MNKRITLATVLVGLIIAGLIAGFFTGSIQKALSAPMVQMMGGTGMPKAVQAAPQPAQPRPTTPGVTPMVNTLAQDTFQRQKSATMGNRHGWTHVGR